MARVQIESGDESFEAELADSVFSHFIGMRFRLSGKMLFEFGREKNPWIDMFLVRDSLYMYFIDENREVIDVKEARPWGFSPLTWRFYTASESYRFLLESFESLGLETGDSVKFDL